MSFSPIARVLSWLHIHSADEPFFLLPYQISSLARQVSVTLHIFISQVSPPQREKSSSRELSEAAKRELVELDQYAQAASVESNRLVELELSPFRGDAPSTGLLQKGMKAAVMSRAVMSNAQVMQAVAEAAAERKKREEHRP